MNDAITTREVGKITVQRMMSAPFGCTRRGARVGSVCARLLRRHGCGRSQVPTVEKRKDICGERKLRKNRAVLECHPSRLCGWNLRSALFKRFSEANGALRVFHDSLVKLSNPVPECGGREGRAGARARKKKKYKCILRTIFLAESCAFGCEKWRSSYISGEAREAGRAQPPRAQQRRSTC
ncbi:hypothetical protein RR48_10892 [Papilio machaon]|uniref:Uncharacterized protein n=1 Tax=Papilio machaon TaxID=76193 RepID=A0A194R7A6_PAPMA|nr:hypothetical protein RR48_10892 [Papilio machaon]